MSRSFSPFLYTYLILNTLLSSFQVNAQQPSATSNNLDPLIKTSAIWKANPTHIKKRFPQITWAKTKVANQYSSQASDMLLWGQPVKKVLLTIDPETQLVKNLTFRVLTEYQTKEKDKKQLSVIATKWKNQINKKLQTKSLTPPTTKINGQNLSREAWMNDKALVVFSVYSNQKINKIDITYHEPISGLTTLGIKKVSTDQITDKQEIKPNTEAKTTSETTKITGKSISRASTHQLKKQFNIKDNFNTEWPKLVKAESPEITTVKEDKENKVFIYQSPNYEFVCDVQISKTIIKNFSTLFEATRAYCNELPLSMVKAHMPENTVKFKILLFGSKENYIKNGGPTSSAGVYMPSSGVIMVPLSSLGVKKVGSKYMFDYKATNKTLPHEIAHQLTNTEYFAPGPRGWFSEGLAEYIAVTDYRSGKFMVNGNLNEIRRYVTGFSRKDNRGRNIGEEFTAPDLKQFMLMSYGEFTANGNFNYGLGALITYYFLHMDNDGDRKNIIQFLTALNEGKQGEEALKVLLAGRTFDELEKLIHKAWRSRGVKINFK